MAPPRRRWLMQGAALAAPFAMVGLVVAEPETEQGGSDPQPTIKELMRRLEERDALIVDLQRRVGELERQSATTADRAPPVNQPPVAAQPVPSAPPVASSAEQEPSTQAEAPAVEGGAAPAVPGQFEVDEEAAERALDRTLVLTGALLLPFGQADIEPSFTYIRNQEEAPTFFVAQGTQFIASQEDRRNIFNGDLFLRFGLPFDSQLEVDIPYRYVEQRVVTEVGFGARAETESHGSGFGDLSVGLAKGLLHERNWWPDLIGRVTWDTDSGETSDDGFALGSGFNELQGSLTMTKRQDPLVFIGSASYGTTFEKDDINPGDQLGFSVGALLAASPETSLRVVLNQTFVNELEVGDRAIGGSDQVFGTLNFGASSIVGRGRFLDLTAGIGLTDEAPDYSVGISVSFRIDVPTRF
jgi:Putative MetA-pathway of phenol degradation